MKIENYLKASPDEAIALLRSNFIKQMRSDLPVSEKAQIAFSHALAVEQAGLYLRKEDAGLATTTLREIFHETPKEQAFAPAICEMRRAAQGYGIDIELR